MPLLLLLAALLLGGCGGPNRGVSTYLRQVQAFQLSLANFKTEMAAVQNRPVLERKAAYLELAGQVRQRGAEFSRLQPPPPAAPLHADLQEMFTVLAEYLEMSSQAGGPEDPRLVKLAARWTQALARAEGHMDRLGH